MSHVLKRGSQDSSSDKGICCQAWVRAKDPKGGKRNISDSCTLPFTTCTCMQEHTYATKNKNKFKKLNI